jgi:phosphonoacetate hydrolase
MLDRLGFDYFEKSHMPNLKHMAREGLFKWVDGVFPSITNVNNVSIACGAWPDEHGITGNSYFNEATESAEYMNTAELIEMVVIGDKDTLFGDLPSPYEELPSTYRAHGSLHEMALPIIICNYSGNLPPEEDFKRNKELLHFLFRS